jgi:catechol 2,3-dioxygenase-like lactoylglutathione lyase family enzyme
MNSSIRHIALFVPDLRAAERYYQSIFDMELIGREAELADGLWYTLPFDKGRDEADAAGLIISTASERLPKAGAYRSIDSYQEGN